jgi:predicted ATPase
MVLGHVHVRGYRSLRDLRLPLSKCTLVIGPNGSGKTNLYRSVQLVAEAAAGGLGRSIAEEGGMQSILWAGERRKDERNRVAVELGWDDLTYTLELALPNPHGFGFNTRFSRDPLVASETIRAGTGKRSPALLERGHMSCMVRNAEGAPVRYPVQLVESESVLAQIAEPHVYPELSAVRQRLGQLRFYHHFRTDPGALLREPRVGTRTPVLANDGADLAAAIVTVEEVGDRDAFHEHIARAFDGAKVSVEDSSNGRFVVAMRMPGMRRALSARELSDGTLRYLCLLAALLSPRPAPLLVLNEPETSLHPDLLAALVEPIAATAERSQMLVLTHAHAFADAVAARVGASRVELCRTAGATTVRGGEAGDADPPPGPAAFRPPRRPA